MNEHIYETAFVERRTLLLGPLFFALADCSLVQRAQASKLNPLETIITLPSALKWTEWSGLPPHSGEMATVYGDLNTAGPYVVFMKWHPGYMSAPHRYASDRLSVVVSGTWWVNSGRDFDPNNSVPDQPGVS